MVSLTMQCSFGKQRVISMGIFRLLLQQFNPTLNQRSHKTWSLSIYPKFSMKLWNVCIWNLVTIHISQVFYEIMKCVHIKIAHIPLVFEASLSYWSHQLINFGGIPTFNFICQVRSQDYMRVTSCYMWWPFHVGRSCELGLLTRVSSLFSYQSVIGKSSVHSELLVPLRLVAILEANKLKVLSLSFMRSR